MIKKEITIAGKRCFVFADEEPEVLLVEPMDLRDLDFLDKEIETLKAGTARPFALATLIIGIPLLSFLMYMIFSM